MRNRRSWALAALALALVLGAIHVPLLLGQVSPIWDAFDAFGPYAMLVGDFAQQGRLLLWNPFVFGGSPDYLEPQVGAFSPLLLMTGLIAGGSRHGFELYWLAIWWFGGAGVLVLARSLGAPAWGALVAALGWSLSGFYTGNAEHTPMIATVSSLPWMVWRMDVAIVSQRWRPAAEAGALWGLFALGGYPGFVLLNGSFTALWSLGRLLFTDSKDSPTDRTRALAHGVAAHALMALVGIAVMAPTYAGILVEGPGYSRRGGALPRRDAVEANALAPARLATLINPRLALVDTQDRTDISMRSVYVGWLVPILAAFALLSPRRWLRWWLLIVGIGFLSAAMGSALPVRGWLYDWLPPMRYFRHSAIFRCYFMFALTILCGFGARDLQAMLRPARRWIPALLVIIALADAVATSRILRSLMYGTAGETWRTLGSRHSPNLDLTESGLMRVHDNGRNLTFVSKTPALAGYGPLPGPLFTHYIEDSVLSASATGPDRLWFARVATSIGRSEECLNAFKERARMLGAPPLVIHSSRVMADAFQPRRGDEAAVPCEVDMHQLPAAARLPATVLQVRSYEPTSLSLRVDVPDDGWLLVTDSWSLGWRARVNGESAPLWGGNFIFRAVKVRAGANQIEFSYHPFGYPWLLVVSWGTLAAVASMSAFALSGNRTRQLMTA
jgi:hypothetical protein